MSKNVRRKNLLALLENSDWMNCRQEPLDARNIPLPLHKGVWSCCKNERVIDIKDFRKCDFYKSAMKEFFKSKKQRARAAISASLRRALRKKGFKKIRKIEDVLGCSIEFFKSYLESQFESWMTWDNYGNMGISITMINTNLQWDIDHIVPICTARSVEEIHSLYHYTNLRPLCSVKNRWVKKGRLTA